MNQITSNSKRFGGSPDLLNYYLDSYSPRLSELSWLVRLANITGPAKVLNVPSESRFLCSLAPSWNIDFADFEVSKYMEEKNIKKTCSGLSDIEENTYDAVVGIVPLHHLSDQEQIKFITGAKQRLISGGRLVIAEPLRGSRTAVFLDDFIDCYSATGHIGNYPTEGLLKTITQAGFERVRMETIDCGLAFSSEEETIDWFRKVFGLQFSNKTTFFERIKSGLGFEKTNEHLRFGWELTFFIAEA